MEAPSPLPEAEMNTALDIVFDPNVPDEVQAAIQPLVDKHKHVLPGWLISLYISWQDGEGSLSVTTSRRYRLANLFVHPAFLESDKTERSRILLHEFIHIVQAPMQEFVDDLLEHGGFNEELKEWLIRRWDEATEETAQDLSFAFHG